MESVWSRAACVACLLSVITTPRISSEPTSSPNDEVLTSTITDSADPYLLDFSKNCGPVCLQFLCEYFDRSTDLPTIVRACPVGMDGTTVGNIESAGRELGLHTMAFRGNARHVARLKNPAIVRYEWSNDLEQRERKSSDHFVVILGYDGSNNTRKKVGARSANRSRRLLPPSHFFVNCGDRFKLLTLDVKTLAY